MTWARKFDGTNNYLNSVLNVEYAILPPNLLKEKYSGIN